VFIILFLLTEHEGYASIIVSLQLCLEWLSILTLEPRQFTGLTFDDKVCQLTVGQLLSQDGTEDMEVTAFVPTVGYLIKEANMPLMA
jgi:hypothetical protein